MDTDLYKINMQCAVLKYFPDVVVEYSFTNRTPHMRLNLQAVEWLRRQIEWLESLQLEDNERQYLQNHCPYLDDEYLQYLQSLRLNPKEQIKVSATPSTEAGFVDLDIRVEGLWVETILYEIPLLALTSEAYFRFVDTDWSHEDQEQLAYEKGVRLLEAGCQVSEFGSRRRRDFHTQDLVIRGLVRAMKDSPQAPGRIRGTSNVYFAMKHGVNPIGTVAHEWYMAIAAMNDDYENANELGLKYWLSCFGEGVMGVALTDSFGTPNFFEAFKKPALTTKDFNQKRDSVTNHMNGCTQQRAYADVFTGIRQDSGDPSLYIERAAAFYNSMGIKGKGIIFSDSLDVDKCIKYKAQAESHGLKPSFGVGTFFTNDFRLKSDPSTKSKPMNIVIKVSKAQGRPCIKLSDDMGKHSGDKAKVKDVKARLGYTENASAEFDEAKRW